MSVSVVSCGIALSADGRTAFPPCQIETNEPSPLPLTEAEYKQELAAIDSVSPLRFDAKGVTRLLNEETKTRLQALIQLMKWSGLAIQDAVKIRKADIIHEKGSAIYRVVTARQKTGTHVVRANPTSEVAQEILAAPSRNPEYIFWAGKSKSRCQVTMWDGK